MSFIKSVLEFVYNQRVSSVCVYVSLNVGCCNPTCWTSHSMFFYDWGVQTVLKGHGGAGWHLNPAGGRVGVGGPSSDPFGPPVLWDGSDEPSWLVSLSKLGGLGGSGCCAAAWRLEAEPVFDGLMDGVSERHFLMCSFLVWISWIHCEKDQRTECIIIYFMSNVLPLFEIPATAATSTSWCECTQRTYNNQYSLEQKYVWFLCN